VSCAAEPLLDGILWLLSCSGLEARKASASCFIALNGQLILTDFGKVVPTLFSFFFIFLPNKNIPIGFLTLIM
jgi:hypothetical protein